MGILSLFGSLFSKGDGGSDHYEAPECAGDENYALDAGTSEAAEEEEVGEDSEEERIVSFKIFINGSNDKKVNMIKFLRGMTGLGLKEAKGVVDDMERGTKTDWVMTLNLYDGLPFVKYLNHDSLTTLARNFLTECNSELCSENYEVQEIAGVLEGGDLYILAEIDEHEE